MAKIEMTGIDELIAAIENRAQAVEKHGRAAVKAGAEVLVDNLRQAAPIRSGDGHGHSGHMADSIKAHSVKGGGPEGYTCEVYPDGTRDDGQRYATVGYVLEYGKSSMPARPWMRPTAEKCGEAVAGAIAERLQRE